MEYKKDDLLTLQIQDIGVDGEGIGKADGFTVFVKDAVPGDLVRVKIMKSRKTYGYGKLMELLEPSPDRVEPVCPIARQCGGCQLQALSYSSQLKFKENKVRSDLERIGGFSNLPMEPVIGMENPLHYRNKEQLPVGTSKDGRTICGFYAARTHSIIENKDCALGLRPDSEIISAVLSYMEKYHVKPYDEKTGKGTVRHILLRFGHATDEVMVCLVINGSRLPAEDALVESLLSINGISSISLNRNLRRDNVILGDQIRVLYGNPYITDRIGDISYQISPLSFYQVNSFQTEKLYAKALEYASLTGKETVWDLYCGIGTISLFLARSAKQVYGVEIIPAAVENARENARLNNISNAEFFVGKAEEIVPEQFEKNHVHAEVIVVDPPRKGCDEQLLSTMIRMQPERIVYVSCNSATLARDLKYLCENGYELRKVCPVDQFGMTVHVETVVLLSKK